MRPLTILAWALLVALPLAAADTDPEPPDPKKGKQNGSFLVRLVAKKTAYVLDRQGMTAEKYREAIRDGTIAPPAVDLVLELTNSSKEEVTVRISGSTLTLTYPLKGPAGPVVTYTPKAIKGAKGAKAPPIQNLVLKPGAKHEIAITTLDSSAVGGRSRAQTFWTEPGMYTLSVQFRTSASGAEAGKAKGKKGNPALIRATTLESQPVKLTVKLK